MARALVLGGGGPVGIAWETGVLAGLADAGADVSGAERIVGTSAGSVVGAQIATGRHPRELHAALLAQPARAQPAADEPAAPAGPAPDLQPLFEFMLRRRSGGLPGPDALAEIGAYALKAPTMDEGAFLAQIGRLVPPGSPWPARFACTAVDAATGVFRVWDAAAGVELGRAVASSCAVPGIYPPITIGGARYIDGGMRSTTNADLAGGCDAVLILAVTVQPVAEPMAEAARRELAEVGAARAALVTPDAAALEAFGANLMDASRMREVAAAGFAQGRREAERVGAALG